MAKASNIEKAAPSALATKNEEISALLTELGPDFDPQAESGIGYEKKFRLPTLKWNDRDHPGVLFNTVSEEESDEANVVFLYAQQYRDFSTYDESTSQFTRHCSTPDTRTGVGTVAATGAERQCKGCPHAKWTESADGKRVPPECSEAFAVGGTDVDRDELFLVRFQRSSYSAWERLISRYHSKEPLFFRRYVLGTERVKGKPHSVPTMVPADPERVDKSQIRDLWDAAKLMQEAMPQILDATRDDARTADDTPAPAAGDYVDAPGEEQGFVDDGK